MSFPLILSNSKSRNNFFNTHINCHSFVFHHKRQPKQSKTYTRPSLYRGNTSVIQLGKCDSPLGHHRVFDEHTYPLLTDLSALEFGHTFQTAAFSS